MWGQVNFVVAPVSTVRIIPTRVGTSVVTIRQFLTFKDHPHACGDKPVLNHLELVAHGSSPRVWGQAALALRGKKGVRIIPTRVGTSLAKHVCRSVCRDHPHACGDKVDMWRTSLKIPSSSPRVWGQGQKSTSSHRRRRIIPTRVGTSSPFSERIIFVKDHPHACGDKPFLSSNERICQGSSPRVWGQEFRQLHCS